MFVWLESCYIGQRSMVVCVTSDFNLWTGLVTLSASGMSISQVPPRC